MLGPTQSALPEYRIPDRDTVKSPRLTLREGDWVSFSRIVQRVGYEFGTHSVTKEEWFDAGLAIAAQKANLEPEIVRKVTTVLGLRSPFRWLRQEIYAQLIRPKIQASKNPLARSMWFADLPSPHTGQIERRAARWTGQYDTGWGPSNWDDDCQPPTLCHAKHQHLYEVRDQTSGQRVLVYPDDVLDKT